MLSNQPLAGVDIVENGDGFCSVVEERVVPPIGVDAISSGYGGVGDDLAIRAAITETIVWIFERNLRPVV